MAILWVVLLVSINMAMVLTSNVSLKLSAGAPDWRGLLAWQVLGNLAGFLGVITFTALMRFIPLNVGFGITGGLGFLAVQVVGARLFLHEEIAPVQWLGSTLVVLGICLIAFGSRRLGG